MRADSGIVFLDLGLSPPCSTAPVSGSMGINASDASLSLAHRINAEGEMPNCRAKAAGRCPERRNNRTARAIIAGEYEIRFRMAPDRFGSPSLAVASSAATNLISLLLISLSVFGDEDHSTTAQHIGEPRKLRAVTLSAVRDGLLSEENWRQESYSPEILNYKVGRDHDIRWFAEPFLNLIHHEISSIAVESTYLVPVPSSIAWNDPKFSSQPRPKGIAGSRNRDNRNTVFCGFLSNMDGRLHVANILVRKTSKPEKATLTAAQHAASMELRGLSNLSQNKTAIILIDDVTTDGGTLQGARMIVEKAYPQAVVIGLAIGCTKHPQQFVPLSQ